VAHRHSTAHRVCHGTTRASWQLTCSWKDSSSGLPWKVIDPLTVTPGARPATLMPCDNAVSSVVLLEPEGPITPTTDPGGKDPLAPRSTCWTR
jgi:hypothetical protein